MEGKDFTVALAGNPNVGKSTIFNSLTGMHQHTGNWSGKTVDCAEGTLSYNKHNIKIIDLPGTYSLFSSSNEEKTARNYLCFNEYDAVIIVVDAVCLERNLSLVLQILEITDKAILAVNLIDDAESKKIYVNTHLLSKLLGIPVVATSAVKKIGLEELKERIISTINKKPDKTVGISLYDEALNNVTLPSSEFLISLGFSAKISKWVSVRLIENDPEINKEIYNYLKLTENEENELNKIIEENKSKYANSVCDIKDSISFNLSRISSEIYNKCVKSDIDNYNIRDRLLDNFFTSRITGYPIMITLLCLIFWITIVGSNYPSELLSDLFSKMKLPLENLLYTFNFHEWAINLISDGIYTTLTWVISVMLPPMAIFFPLFTLLEDSGYLPRIAFNLDRYFKKACAHGKQSLTMCMGFGCNACGVTGCRIIDSPREKLIAIITNVFVPCNGRFPGMIALISMFFLGSATGIAKTIKAALILCGVILFGVFITLIMSKLLSKTILKGLPSSFILELPPYRKPQFFKVIIQSIRDRTIFVLGRAVAVAAPFGAVIWIMANIHYGDSSILNICTEFLHPFASLMGMDGVILMAFILGFPANEIVIPLIIMTYVSSGVLTDFSNISELKMLLVDNGWTLTTAICTMLFSLIHFPCATTCLTIYKETNSIKWTAAAFFIPLSTGIVICISANFIMKFILF